MNIEHQRHTLAHLLAAAVRELYPDAKPTIGPAVDNGFYYDFDDLKNPDLPALEAKMKELLPSWTDSFPDTGLVTGGRTLPSFGWRRPRRSVTTRSNERTLPLDETSYEVS